VTWTKTQKELILLLLVVVLVVVLLLLLLLVLMWLYTPVGRKVLNPTVCYHQQHNTLVPCTKVPSFQVTRPFQITRIAPV
jgi:hypothetical protein